MSSSNLSSLKPRSEKELSSCCENSFQVFQYFKKGCRLHIAISLLSVWWLSTWATDWPGYADPPRHLSCRLPRRCSTNNEPDLPEPVQIMKRNRTISLPDESHRLDRTSMKTGFQDWEKQLGEVPRRWAPRRVGTRLSPWGHCKSCKTHKI